VQCSPPLNTPLYAATVLAPGLSKNAFLRAQQFVFQHTGGDEEKLRNEFRILGYSARYIQCSSLSFERAYDPFSDLGCAILAPEFFVITKYAVEHMRCSCTAHEPANTLYALVRSHVLFPLRRAA
jgi:hypothetical protein